MNQHARGESDGDLSDLMGNLERAVRGTQGTIMVMDEQGGPFMRVWCLLEVWTTLQLKGLGELHIVMSSSASKQQVSRAFVVTWPIIHTTSVPFEKQIPGCLAGYCPEPRTHTHGATVVTWHTVKGHPDA